jgi:uncharacterized protein (DUF849 family)
VLLECCLNGGRRRSDHPACPITPQELARDAALVVAAGAGALHAHPRDAAGNETLDGGPIGEALSAIRETASVPLGVSTGAWIEPDPGDRLRAIEGWEVLPDFASVNFNEPGAIDVARSLADRGVGVEAGLWHEDAAAIFAASGLADRCLRILLEPTEHEAHDALANVARIEQRLVGVAAHVPRLLHGLDRTAWPILEEAARRGYDVRIGLEDTLDRPDGRRTTGNEELVTVAAARARPG